MLRSLPVLKYLVLREAQNMVARRIVERHKVEKSRRQVLKIVEIFLTFSYK
jgi:hypothetical protein